MKIHKIITVVIEISILVAILIRMDVRPTQAAGNCEIFDVPLGEVEEMVVMEPAEVLSRVSTTDLYIRDRRVSEVDDTRLLLTICEMDQTDFDAFLSTRPYHILEFPTWPVHPCIMLLCPTHHPDSVFVPILQALGGS